MNEQWKAGFDDVREEQLKAGMAATPKQRIEMLEALIAFAVKAGALPNPTSRQRKSVSHRSALFIACSHEREVWPQVLPDTL